MHRLLVLLALVFACGDDAGDGVRDGGLDASAPEPVPSDGALPMDAESCVAPDAQRVEVMSALHVTGDVVYPDPPPAGGNHNGCWGTWGVHESELADERWVHNLEHGGVVFLYRCPDGCSAELASLRAFVEGHDLALLTPYAQLPTKFGVVSWGHRLLSDCFDGAAFERFYDAHRDMGLESVSSDPPAECRR
jgi:hypothetical protein